MTEDEKAIRKVVDDWMAATRAGDKETVLNLVADDVIFITPFGPPFGKNEFASAQGDNADMPEIDGKSDILEMEVMGERAWIRNQIDIQITSPDGDGPKKMSGQTLTLLKKGADGQWRVFRDANFVKPEV